MTDPTPEQLRALADENEDWVGYTSPRVDRVLNVSAGALRAAADQLEAVRAEVTRYAGWHEQSPEDSWRFERDLRTALGMEQYSGEDDD